MEKYRKPLITMQGNSCILLDLAPFEENFSDA
jgi:hypothetical protein